MSKKQFNNYTKSQHHALTTTNSRKKKWDLLENCQKYALNFFKCLYLVRIGRPDVLWSVNKLARSNTEWTKACDKRLNRLISNIHSTHVNSGNIVMCEAQHTTMQIRIAQDSDFAGDLEDSKSTSVGLLCIFGSHTFVPISWMCKKQTSVSRSSTEAEVISLDACLRMDGIPALDLWDFVIVLTLYMLRPSVDHQLTLCRLLPDFLQTSCLCVIP